MKGNYFISGDASVSKVFVMQVRRSHWIPRTQMKPDSETFPMSLWWNGRLKYEVLGPVILAHAAENSKGVVSERVEDWYSFFSLIYTCTLSFEPSHINTHTHTHKHTHTHTHTHSLIHSYTHAWGEGRERQRWDRDKECTWHISCTHTLTPFHSTCKFITKTEIKWI